MANGNGNGNGKGNGKGNGNGNGKAPKLHLAKGSNGAVGKDPDSGSRANVTWQGPSGGHVLTGGVTLQVLDGKLSVGRPT